MPTVNQGDAFLQACRTRLLTATLLPATRQWQNQRGSPPANKTSAWVEDMIVRWDSEPRECGPDAWARAEVDYGVMVRVPHGTDVQTCSNIVQNLIDVFRSADLSVDGNSAYFMAARAEAPTQEPEWLAWPVTISFQYDYP